MKRKRLISSLVICIFLLGVSFSECTEEEELEEKLVEQKQLVNFSKNHFTEICSSVILPIFILLIAVMFWFLCWIEEEQDEIQVREWGKIVYPVLGCIFVLSLLGVWGTLNWSWDMPSQYFGGFYWTNLKLAIFGGLILSLIVFLPFFSRESLVYEVLLYLFGEKRENSLPNPAPLKFFIPWTVFKLVFGIWLLSSMRVGLWFLGGNGLTLFSRDFNLLYGQLLVIGPPIAGALVFRFIIYIIHQVVGIYQYMAEGVRQGLDKNQYQTVIGKVCKTLGVVLMVWGVLAVFGITGNYESLVGPYRHNLFSIMFSRLGAGLACLLIGGFLIGDNTKQKLYHIAGAIIFTIIAVAFAMYYSPDFRVTIGLLGIVVFLVSYVLMGRIVDKNLYKGQRFSDLYGDEIVDLLCARTLGIAVVIVLVLIGGGTISSVWLKPAHQRNPLSINADLIETELMINSFSAGIDFQEREWEFPLDIGIKKLEDIDALIKEQSSQETFRIIRLWDAPHTKVRFVPTVGKRWMEMGDTDIVRFTIDGELKQYWVSPKNLQFEEILRGSGNAWYNEHKVYTHSVGFVVADALTGNFEDFDWCNNDIYFGEGKHRKFIYDFDGRELEGAYTGPTVNPRVPLLNVFRRELRFYTGETVAFMNIFDMAGEILPWMDIDPDPYICVDNDNQEVWYSMDLGVHLTPSEIPLAKAPYIRPLVKLLINTETGEYQVYYNEKSNDDIIMPLLLRVYGDNIKPLSEAPSWYMEQLRYPEVFMEIQVKAGNIYHVDQCDYSDTDKSKLSVYIHEEDFFEIPEEEDLRHVLQTFLSNRTEFVSMISVEFSGKKVPNIAAIWVVQNDYPNYGSFHLIRVPTATIEELRVIGTSVVPNSLTADEEISYWKKTHESADIGNIILYHVGNRVYYFVPFYTGREKTITLQKVACVMALTGSETESRKVGFGDDVVTSFRNLHLEILASRISGRDVGTYDEAVRILSGETIATGESVGEILQEMQWLYEKRMASLVELNETQASKYLQEFFNLFEKLLTAYEDGA